MVARSIAQHKRAEEGDSAGIAAARPLAVADCSSRLPPAVGSVGLLVASGGFAALPQVLRGSAGLLQALRSPAPPEVVLRGSAPLAPVLQDSSALSVVFRSSSDLSDASHAS